MKIIDLLNKIANGEEVPEKIKYDDEIFIYDNRVDKYWSIDHTNNLHDILSRYVGIALDDEVEIIEDKPKTLNDIREGCGLPRIEEDKKIEKIKTKIGYGHLVYLENESFKDGDMGFTNRENVIVDKINEIIDKLNKEK